ncbi:MAG: hypothetical protein ABGX05_15840, partial [Pirellulaceae bacterium]
MKTTSSLLLLALIAMQPANAAEKAPATPRSRQFRLDIGATVKALPRGATLRVWLPVPPSNQNQTVKALTPSLPARGKLSEEPKYGNQVLYFQKEVSSPGPLRFNTPYQIERHEVRALEQKKGQQQALAPSKKELYLAPNQKVPLTGQPLKLLAQVEL